MKKITLFIVFIVISSMLFSDTTRAETARDLFKKYNITDSTELDETTKEWNKASSDYRDLVKEYAFTDLYNTVVSMSDSSSIVNELNIYQPMCSELEQKMLSNIDADISEIISDENKYLHTLDKVNILLNALDSYRGITNTPIPDEDIQQLKTIYEETTVKKDELMTKSDIGVVENIIQPIQAEYKLVSKYGTRAITGNVEETEFHHGIDLAAEIGTGVLSIFNGTVIYSGYDETTGETIKIDHGNEIITVYENLRDRYVKEGDTVKQYQKIGAVGTTSKETTHPYLHLALYIKDKSYDLDKLFRKEIN